MASKSFVFRFDDIEVHEKEFSLFKAGKVLSIEPKAFRALLFLVHNPQRLITKQELLDAVWGDAVVSEGSLTRCIWLLRSVLGDDTRNTRYIETVATVGYRFVCPVEVIVDAQASLSASTPTNIASDCQPAQINVWLENEALPAMLPPKNIWTTRWRWILTTTVLCVGVVVSSVWYLRGSLPPPHITDVVQITHTGNVDFLAGSDGSKLYFNQMLPSSPYFIAQVGIASREIVPLSVGLPDATVQDVSPDGTALLVSSENRGQTSLWSVEIAGGTHRLLAPDGVNGAWSPDGKFLVFLTRSGEVFVSQSDGTGARILVPAETLGQESRSANFAWSPDGSKIRFNALSNARIEKLFEISSDGSGLHELIPSWRPSSGRYNGRWTPDGRFYLFLSDSPRTIGAQMWVLDERRGQYRKSPPDPVLLSSSAIEWGAPISSKDGKKIFSIGTTLHGELVRYDTQSQQFQPFLGGISAEFVAFSPDGQSIVYVSFPDGILWKANRDGSGTRPLADSALYATFPRWSPDGSKILLNRGTKAYLTPSSGFGSLQPVLPDDKGDQNEPNWSPDGSRIVFSTGGEGEIKSDIRILFLASQKVSILPGSVGLFSPRWSPDGRLIAALDVSSTDLKIFDFETKKWSLLQKGPIHFPKFSHDGRFIYFVGLGSNRLCVLRIRTSGGDAVPVVHLGISVTGIYDGWMDLDPEDAPMLLRDRGSKDIYALTLETK